MFAHILRTVFFLTSHIIFSYSKEDINIDLDDIMAPKYMPDVLFLDKTNYNTFNSTITHGPEGSISDALDTMTFHRMMMNQYLCRTYVANKIISSFKREKIQKRRSDGTVNLLQRPKDANQELLYDEGSSTYNNWLSKSSIYEDIYKNHDYTNQRSNVLPLESSREEGINEMTVEHHGTNIPLNALNNQHIDYRNTALESPGKLFIFCDAGIVSKDQIVEQEPVIFHYTSNNPTRPTNVGKSQQLTDIFEVALTAVAFLSFGMFVVHLVISISSMHSQSTTTPSMFMPMSMNPTATAPDLGEDTSNDNGSASIDDNTSATDPDEINTGNDENEFNTGFGDSNDSEWQDDRLNFRLKRGIPAFSNPSTQALNEMAKRILSSIDASLLAYADNGTCLEKSICLSNQYSTKLPGLNKFILPIWNLGLILVQQVISNNKGSTTRGLRAAVLGLGNARCKIIYQSCNVKKYKNK
ncbi:uncharacterized protein LOC143198057 isoform X1 [Rhynchophorus ferrugineus]|uniref:uncharacterized protein LOC143198057 isoform X1 n=1 Tax=Rhynchophorus ferrugineus TaxID=354439 RepID=UPI003FCE73E9